MNIVQAITQDQLRKDIPSFRPGDTLKVYVKVIEGSASVSSCSKVWSLSVVAAESAKHSPFVRFLTA